MLTHRSRRLFGAIFGSLFVLSCSDGAGPNPFSDLNIPNVTLTAVGSADTVLTFKADVADNLGIKHVNVSVTGGASAVFDTTFNFAVTSLTLNYNVGVSRSVPPGTAVIITATATDGAGNVSPVATLVMGVGSVSPSQVIVTSPPNGTVAVIGKSVLISISGKAATKVKSLGFRTSGVATVADSTLFSSPLKDSTAILDTLTIPSTASPGTLSLTPFLIDSLGQTTQGQAITITVQTPENTTAVPTVTFGMARRVEVKDTINVFASDPSGLTRLGYEFRLAPGGSVTVGDSVAGNGSFTTLSHTFNFSIGGSVTPPATIYVKAFALNSNGARSYAKLASGEDRVDTVLVVAGETTSLPDGGRIADALYHPGRDRLYMTNIERNRLEVFSLGLGGFEQPISTGSRPWGIAAWPANRQSMSNRVLVANSGGTSLSYIDVAMNVHERTYPLPNIIAYSVTTTQSSDGFPMQQRTKYDFSDRPQFLATTCPSTDGVNCTDVIVVYSTTPTAGQSVPFPNQGTVRWENLTTSDPARRSHFFFEQAVGQTSGRADTLEIVRFKAFDEIGPDSTILVPYRNQLLGGPTPVPYSVVVDLPKLAFRDTTFARNSGNFARAILGEGGPVAGSRAIFYSSDVGLVTTVNIEGTNYTFQTPVLDGGISRAADVSDYTGNTFARVRGVAINFDGRLAAVRGDSTFLLDPTLRLQGLLQTSGGNPGFDFHPQNSGNPNVGVSNGFAYAASTEPMIQVFENTHYSLVCNIPVRDPIVGPIKAALRPSGEKMLVGATANGVVLVRLPNTPSGCQ